MESCRTIGQSRKRHTNRNQKFQLLTIIAFLDGASHTPSVSVSDRCGRLFGRLAKSWEHQSVQVDCASLTPLLQMWVIAYLYYYLHVISQFLEACIERQPDILLTEMQDQLREFVVSRFWLQRFQEHYVGDLQVTTHPFSFHICIFNTTMTALPGHTTLLNAMTVLFFGIGL